MKATHSSYILSDMQQHNNTMQRAFTYSINRILSRSQTFLSAENPPASTMRPTCTETHRCKVIQIPHESKGQDRAQNTVPTKCSLACFLIHPQRYRVQASEKVEKSVCFSHSCYSALKKRHKRAVALRFLQTECKNLETQVPPLHRTVQTLDNKFKTKQSGGTCDAGEKTNQSPPVHEQSSFTTPLRDSRKIGNKIAETKTPPLQHSIPRGQNRSANHT